MKVDEFPASAELIAHALDNVIDEAERDEHATFSSLVIAAGLDPARDFVGASLVDLDFRKEDLRGFDFSDADLTGVDFRGANLEDVSFNNAILTRAIGLDGWGPIFLSYARDDYIAARRLRDFLEEAGINVWVDDDKLRSGVDWDHAVRRQIELCSFFMPVISRTATRIRDGYFRREWALAAERSLEFRQEEVFIIPVCIDDTPWESEGLPAAFRIVRWELLPGGEGDEWFRNTMKELVRHRRTHGLYSRAGSL